MMRIVAGICFSCFLMFSAAAVPATVDYVLDGDTFAARVLLDEDITITVRVRLADVDTPEINGKCEREIEMALRARDRLAELLPVGTMVDLRDVTDDKYLGRIDARVFTSDGRDVSRILINEKLGRPYDGGRRDSWCDQDQ